jgi:hypothetical protein
MMDAIAVLPLQAIMDLPTLFRASGADLREWIGHPGMGYAADA